MGIPRTFKSLRPIQNLNPCPSPPGPATFLEVHYLVDGYSLIHSWPHLRQALKRRLSHARDLLIHELQHYQDQTEDHVSVYFDGRSGGSPKAHDRGAGRKKRTNSRAAIQIVFSSEGQSADTLIEQLVGASKSPSHYIVVTGDFGIQNTIHALGASSISPDMFHEMIRISQKEFEEWLGEHKFKTKRKFNRG